MRPKPDASKFYRELARKEKEQERESAAKEAVEKIRKILRKG